LPKISLFLPLFDSTPPIQASPQPAAPPPAPPDASARAEALDIRRSFIVEAPAGSGKTGLLIQRFLKLLTDEAVTEPEQVLAITFTIAATAEMRDRVLAHLEGASRELPATASSFDRQTRDLALAVLERDRRLGWALLDHPLRLNLRTIDSVCAEIARSLPVLSGSGGRLTPTLDATPLHREAARRTLLLLGNDDAGFNAALRNLLLHRDGNLADCESLIANMLSLRDQWGSLIPLAQDELDEAWLDAKVLPKLEKALERAICSQLARLEQIFPSAVLAELSALAAELGQGDGYRGEPSPIAVCCGRSEPPEALADHLEHWLALIHILLTPKGKGWRKSFSPYNVKFVHDKRYNAQMTAIVNQLSDRDDLLQVLLTVRGLPPARYPADQWAVAKSLFRVLRRALVELQLVFAAHNQCDFTEVSLLARQALNEDSGADDLAAALGARLQHLLVDEMQDTSTGQYDLIEMLTKSWDGHSQTVFLVGDPRQSIYLFRQARVERFMRATRTGLLGTLPLTRLQLTANFRSQSNLVDRFNQDFALIFPQPVAADPYALPYSPADATLPASPDARALVWHPHPLPYVPRANLASPATSGIFPTVAQLRHHQAGRSALEIRRIAQLWLARPLPPGRTKPWTLAVLVRSRNHLAEIVAEFEKDRFGKIPCRAVEITRLNERQEVLDLTALTRAILHPADRVATLAVLRAPWCALSLADLHALTGSDDPATKLHSILRLIADRGHLLPADSRQRLSRVQAVLDAAGAQRARLTTSQLVERAWRSLGGDAWLSSTELTNTRRFFQLLDSLETSAAGIDSTLLDEHLQELYAEPNPIPDGAPCVELLTIHSAKGLEWDVVFIPALERMPGSSKARLLNWSEVGSPDDPDDDAAHVMLAPIAGRGKESTALNNWLNRVEAARNAAERKRLFYVACTRAREELHLFATPETTVGGAVYAQNLSLLKSAWPAAEPHFQMPAATSTRKPATPADSPPLALAAAADPFRPVLQRLPLAFDPAARFTQARSNRLSYGEAADFAASAQTPFSRPEGSFAARSFGNAVHACLQMLADRILAQGASPAALLAEIPSWTPRIAAILRADGLPQSTVTRLTRETRAALENVLRDPNGLWLLASHPGGDAELAVTAFTRSREPAGHTAPHAESVRIDRIFHAGPEPHAPGEDFLWIVDYKTTTHGPAGLDHFLAEQRATYGPQLQTYARILAPARSKPSNQIRLALYFPALPHLVWWPAPAPSTEN
jgi:ATP-dependent exoDNAse (exonuclease V) beta subunit